MKRTQSFLALLVALAGLTLARPAQPLWRAVTPPIAVTVSAMVGVPKDQVVPLTMAIWQALNANGMREVATAQRWYQLTLFVETPEQGDGSRVVVLSWEVRTSTGERLGEVRQTNTLPPGIDMWREIATRAVGPAVLGISRLVWPHD